MNKTQIAANIITSSALDALATKHKITVAQVVNAIYSGDVRAMGQFAALVKCSIETATSLHAAGQISLV